MGGGQAANKNSDQATMRAANLLISLTLAVASAVAEDSTAQPPTGRPDIECRCRLVERRLKLDHTRLTAQAEGLGWWDSDGNGGGCDGGELDGGPIAEDLGQRIFTDCRNRALDNSRFEDDFFIASNCSPTFYEDDPRFDCAFETYDFYGLEQEPEPGCGCFFPCPRLRQVFMLDCCLGD